MLLKECNFPHKYHEQLSLIHKLFNLIIYLYVFIITIVLNQYFINIMFFSKQTSEYQYVI